MKSWVWALAGVLLSASGFVDQQVDQLESVREARLAGHLDRATERARAALGSPNVSPGTAVGLYLELARIQDRIGLHTNSRPVSQATQYADSAYVRLTSDTGSLAADVRALYAELSYRAEMGTDFAIATEYANDALQLYRASGDGHGEADAVHRLGLIALQRDEFPEARRLFEESLRLDQLAGRRTFFQGEYERHIALVELSEQNPIGAIPHLQRSLSLRRESGAIDAAMFAANTLAATLIEVGRTQEAAEPLLYAVTIGQSIDSPVGETRNSLVAGRLHAALGHPEAARRAFEKADSLATIVGSENMARQARAGIAQLSRAP